MFTKKAPTHFLVFASVFVFTTLFFVFYSTGTAVSFEPEEEKFYHTFSLYYYNGEFSHKLVNEDLQTVIHFANFSDEEINLDITEYRGFGKIEKIEEVLAPQSSYFIKPEVRSDIKFSNEEGTRNSIVRIKKILNFRIILENFFLPNDNEGETLIKNK